MDKLKDLKKGDLKSKMCRITVCSIYVSPRSRKKQETCEFVTSSVYVLKSRYDDLKFLIGGDVNTLYHKPMLDSLPYLKQVVERPTHGNKILDVIVTDI